MPVIASGGAGTLEHLADALHAGADAALAASIFHYGTHRVREAKAHLAAAGTRSGPSDRRTLSLRSRRLTSGDDPP